VRYILNVHQNRSADQKQPAIEVDTLRKYIAYARQRVFPRLSEDATQNLNAQYVKLRSDYQKHRVRTDPNAVEQQRR
jgi:DNA replication licensing factor MCM5